MDITDYTRDISHHFECGVHVGKLGKVRELLGVHGCFITDASASNNVKRPLEVKIRFETTVDVYKDAGYKIDECVDVLAFAGCMDIQHVKIDYR